MTVPRAISSANCTATSPSSFAFEEGGWGRDEVWEDGTWSLRLCNGELIGFLWKAPKQVVGRKMGPKEGEFFLGKYNFRLGKHSPNSSLKRRQSSPLVCSSALASRSPPRRRDRPQEKGVPLNFSLTTNHFAFYRLIDLRFAQKQSTFDSPNVK